MEVTLTWYELWMAAMVGVRRQVEAVKRGLPDAHGYRGDGWGNHIEGAAGEMAAAKALGMYWSGSVNTFHDLADVGTLHVRTRSEKRYELLVRPDDEDDGIYLLVLGMSPTYTVRGWLYGRDAKQTEFLATHGNRPAAYFVPHRCLRSIDELRALVADGVTA